MVHFLRNEFETKSYQASVVVDVQEWIEANFQFFELFWETYGRFL